MSNMMSFLFVGTIGWGVSLFLIKLLLICMPPLEIVLYRMGIGSVTLFIFVIFLRIKITDFVRLCKEGMVVGMLNMTIPFYLTAYAEKSISVSLVACVNGLTPVITFLIGIILFKTKQKITLSLCLSLLIGFTGIMLINFDKTLNYHDGMSLLALFSTSISYGIAAHYVKTKASTREPLLLAAMACTMATLFLLLIKLFYSPNQWYLSLSFYSLILLVWLGSIGSGVTLYLYCRLIHRTNALMTSMVVYLMILTGVMMGLFFLNEQLTPNLWLGCGCMLLSLLMVNHGEYLTLLLKRRITYQKFKSKVLANLPLNKASSRQACSESKGPVPGESDIRPLENLHTFEIKY